MKKALLTVFSAVVGTAAAAAIHCSFMMIHIESSDMLPSLEPDERVIVFLLSDRKEIKEGDLIAYEPSFYQIDEGKGPVVKRVKEADDSGFVVVGDAALTDDEARIVPEENVLGKVITF